MPFQNGQLSFKMVGYGLSTWVTFAQMKRYLLDISVVAQFRARMGAYFLKRDAIGRTRSAKSVSLDEAVKLGVLFTGEDEQTFNTISALLKELRANGKKVKCLGYVGRPQAAASLRSSQDLDFFSQDDLNWHFAPESSRVRSFLDEPFDMLIDLGLSESFPVLNLVAHSKAKFKVGRFSADNEPYMDLMIETQDAMELREFIAQIKRYLAMLDGKR
jgi:hypothetical protein